MKWKKMQGGGKVGDPDVAALRKQYGNMPGVDMSKISDEQLMSLYNNWKGKQNSVPTFNPIGKSIAPPQSTIVTKKPLTTKYANPFAPGYEYLRDEIGSPISQGKLNLIDTNEEGIGELVYEGKNVSLGYADCREDLIKGDENRGILNTGDIARRDSENFYYIVGRK